MGRVGVIAMMTSALTGCLVTPPPDFPDASPVTAPVIVDLPGVTRPRLGNLVRVVQGDAPVRVTFNVPIDDANPDDPLFYRFFVDSDRDCLTSDAGSGCVEPLFGERASDGNRRRVITQTLTFPTLGCHRVELWASSGFVIGENFRTPLRAGDVAFTTWWVFVRAQPGSTGADGGVVDPVESCNNIVQP